MAQHWNLHRIRPSHGETPPGKLFLSEVSNTMHYKISIDGSDV